MLNSRAVLLFLVTTIFINGVNSAKVVAPDFMVECFSTTDTDGFFSCQGTPIGTMMALDCCTGNGNTFTYESQCLGCLLVGFNQSELVFTSDDISRVAKIDVIVTKKIPPSAQAFISVDSTGFNKPAGVTNEFVADFPTNERFNIAPNQPLQASYDITISSTGNSRALEDPLNFFVTMELTNSLGDFGMIMFQKNVEITVADLDVLEFSFEGPYGGMFTEGHEGTVIVLRGNAFPSRPVSVFVHARLHTGAAALLRQGEFAADAEDFTQETVELVFVAAENSKRVQANGFRAIEDLIVEPGTEVFEVVLTTNESLVKISRNNSIQNLFILDDDDFRIGFERTLIVVSEGENVNLTIEQTNNVIGQLRSSDVLGIPIINNVPGTAGVGVDYNFTVESLLPMTINDTTDQLNPISFSIGSTIVDDILEGAEEFKVRLSQTGILQIGDRSVVTVRILDKTPAFVMLTRRLYTVIENEQSVLVCANITGAVLDLDSTLIISSTIQDITTSGFADHVAFTLEFTFEDQNSEACITLNVVNDLFRELLRENLTITLDPNTNTDFLDLDVDQTPSYIVIIDDDRTEISFEQEFVSFSENAGNQDIFLVLVGGRIPSNLVVSVYDIDTGAEVGRVTFMRVFSLSQRASFSYINTDNEIALEANKTRRLAIREINQIIAAIGSPSEMTVEIVDDDVLGVSFVSGQYDYVENHGEVNDIQLQISHEIARNLTIFINGGPGSQPSTVEISGVPYSNMIQFLAGASASNILTIPSFTINDDEFGLESLEAYQLALTGSTIATNVLLGSPTNISIVNEDVVSVSFESNQYSFDEGSGEQSVRLILNRNISTGFAITVAGVTTPLAEGVADSGSNVNEVVTFSSQGSLLSELFFNITDDIVTGEPVQEYNLSLSNEPAEVQVDPFRTTTISIFDDDQSSVRLVPFMGPLFESAGEYNVTVVLDGKISSPVSVTLLSNAGFNNTIWFQPDSTLTTQYITVTFNIPDDEIALENPEIIRYSLVSPMGTALSMPSMTDVVITDDDVVEVMFVNSTYSFSEGENGMIQLRLSTAIAQDVSISVNGASAIIPNVFNSGPTVSVQTDFIAGGSRMFGFPITIMEDDYALEDLETYSISITALTPNSSNLIIGSPAIIEITSNDVVGVTFGTANNNFTEDSGFQQIQVMIDNPVAQELVVDVFGESLPSFGVSRSGVTVNTSVTFTVGNTMPRSFFITIDDDDVALERDEMYSIMFTGSTPVNGVTLGPDTQVTIIDEDTVMVNFNQSVHSFSENSGQSSGIVVVLSNPIAQSLSVNVFTDPGQQPSTVESSGFSANVTVAFAPFSLLYQSLPNFVITNDEIGLETVELYPLQLVSSNPSDFVILASDSTIEIIDDDIPVIGFSGNFNFTEGDMPTLLELTIDRIIYQDISVTIAGASHQQMGVVNNGPTVNATLTFFARGNLMRFYNLGVSDDFVSRENNEVYDIVITGSNLDATFSSAGSSTTVTILDNDVASIGFRSPRYEFLENAGATRQVMVELNGQIAQDFTVRVFGDPAPVANQVVDSGSIVDVLLTFTAFNTSQDNLVQTVEVVVRDDAVSGEPDQLYDLELQNIPADVMLSQGTATIVIDDNDQSGVRLEPFMGPLYESTGMYNVTVILTGEISSTSSVDVIDENGDVVGIVVFNPMPGVDTQQQTVTITFIDDEIALEDDQIISFSLNNSMGTTINGQAVDVIVTDDDVVTVQFVHQVYNYSENEVSANNIQVQLSNQIANNLTVAISGGPGTQPSSVIVSGVQYSQSIYFPAGSQSFTPVLIPSFMIDDDQVGLESLEEYQLMMTDASRILNVALGQPTTISIADDDAVSVSFQSPQVDFSEGSGEQTIYLSLNRQVAINVVVGVRGETAPLLSGVADSGSDVNELITFTAQGSLQEGVAVNISDDDVSGEPIQQYDLMLIDAPASVTVSPFNSTTIRIFDNDQAGVRFLPFTGPLLESMGEYNITVVLDGEISSSVSVTVLDSQGNIVEVVSFQPIPGQTSQRVVVTTRFNDDDIALEDPETLTFTLTNPINAIITGSQSLDVIVTDDDRVMVMFVNQTYGFNEGDTSEIGVKISNEIAKNLTVLITGVSGPQAGVIVNGPSVSAQLTFLSGVGRMLVFPITIGTDMIGLENIETYPITINNMFSVSNVEIGAPATIEISDTDVVRVNFVSDEYMFSENQGVGVVNVSINIPVANDLAVSLFGVSMPSAGVEISGGMVNSTVVFMALGRMEVSHNVQINDDDVALENEEQFEIRLTGSNPSSEVMLGPSTEVTIYDDDVLTVQFDMPLIMFNENDGRVSVNITLSRDIADDFTINIVGSTMDNPLVTVSGPSNVNVTARFTAGGSRTYTLVLDLMDDENALEDVESLILRLENPSDDRSMIGGDSTVMITDEDVVTVSFSSLVNSFLENESGTFLGVNIDRTILRNLDVSIFGESSPSDGVVISGQTINTTVTFQAQDSQFVFVPVGITDDLVGLENEESFPVQFTSSNPSQQVALGPDAAITINDNDGVTVDFERTLYSFDEDDGTVTVTLVLNRQITEDFTVQVIGGPTDNPFISLSGPNINTTLVFTSGSMRVNLTFTLQDDQDGLEDLETFILSVRDPAMPSANVFATTTIEITDNDIVEVLFVAVPVNVDEDIVSQTVGVDINRNILRDLVVSVSGSSPDQLGVTISGQSLISNVSFVAGGSTSSSFTVGILDDNVALENTEQYDLMFTGSTPLEGVQLGSSTAFNIVDDDNVTVSFQQSLYAVFENQSIIQVTTHIDGPIQSSFDVLVQGGSAPQPSTVVISGGDVNANLTFGPSVLSNSFNVIVTDDLVILEDIEEYLLMFAPVDNDRVIIGEPTRIQIRDDDVLSYGSPDVQGISLIYPENVPTQVFMIEFSPSVRNLTFSVQSSLVNPSTMFLEISLDSITCQQTENGILTLPPSLTPVIINCTVQIIDDNVSQEDDEVYILDVTLTDPNPNTIPVAPGDTRLTLTIYDDDVAVVVTDVTKKNVTEGGDIQACVTLNAVSVRDVTVVLTSEDKMATDGNDFIGGGEKVLIIPAGSTEIHCARYSTLRDMDIEDDEDFDVKIDRVLLSNPPNITFVNPRNPMIGSQSTTTITITDIPPESRSCRIDSMAGIISTFGESKMYMYNRTCEHALLKQQTAMGEFGVFVESLDGTFMTTRIGIRLGSSESVVVNAYNRTIIRQSDMLDKIQVTSTSSKLSISVSSLNFLLEIFESRIVVLSIGVNSTLTDHSGLCGNLNGDFVLRNGTIVDISNMAALNRVISQNLVPPSETFLRMVVRQECGLTSEDLETGDPMFVVPLYTPSEPEPHSYSLCYEIHGYEGDNYNFISDECTQVSGHYYETTDPDPESFRAFHGVDRIDITTVNNFQQCVSISVALDNGGCTATVGGNMLGGEYSSYGVSVRQTGNRTRVSVPNCADNKLIMYIMCQGLGTTVPYVELRVIRGLNLRESSHGVIGQFWNVESRVTKYSQPLRDGTVDDNAYLVELMPLNKPKRSFIGFLYSRTWNFEEFPCIYAGNAQGGPIFEAADGEPNDSLIEGSIRDYIQSNFIYNQFNNGLC